MKRFCVFLLLITAACFTNLAGSAEPAGSTLEQFDQVKGRSYHEMFYMQNSCDVCHDNQEPVNFPADDACTACHKIEGLVEATARPAGEEGQNPHDNLHYGTEVPCMECHGEHESRQHMCHGCHSFDYPNFKQ